MKGIEVINPGLLTTIQDEGRYNFQKFGVPVSGVMDYYSYKVSNMLVGNKGTEAVLEITMIGPALRFQKNAIIAITGGNLGPKINGADISQWRSIAVNQGDVLSFTGIKSGCRSYLAVKGGICVDKVMGSRSTYIKASLGGINGNALQKNDIVPILDNNTINYKVKKLSDSYIPKYSNNYQIRVVKGPQDDYFTEKGLTTFFNNDYKVTSECDRMGFSFEGEPIDLKNGSDIISDGITFGAVQIPGHGKPIIMMADRQTTGGYAKIGSVIFKDLSTLSQAKPGDSVSFVEVTIDTAHKELKELEETLSIIKKDIEKQDSIIIKQTKNYKIKLNGRTFDVKVEEIENC